MNELLIDIFSKIITVFLRKKFKKNVSIDISDLNITKVGGSTDRIFLSVTIDADHDDLIETIKSFF